MKSKHLIIITAATVIALGMVLLVVANRFWFEHKETPPTQPASFNPYLQPPPDTLSVTPPASAEATATPEPSTATPEPTPSPTPVTELALLTGPFVHQYIENGNLIQIQQFITGTGQNQVVYFVAEVIVEKTTYIKSGFAKDTFGRNYSEKSTVIAERLGALLAINGDYYGYRSDGIIIRNGVLYRDVPVREGAALCYDGSLIVYNENDTSGEELLEHGALQSFSFGPILVRDGEAVTEFEKHVRPLNPRTSIGMVSPGHYMLVVVDGRLKGYSQGMDIYELAELMAELGCQTAYNLDGGGTSTMVWDDELVNNPMGTGVQRSISDILYISFNDDVIIP